MLKPGDEAPRFALERQDGARVSLDDLLTAGPVLLFFYPGDFTPVCTREVCMIRDLHAHLRAAGITVAGVSPDPPEKHARFAAAHSLDYALLADPDKRVARQYGVTGPLGFGVRRATFLVDTSRRIFDAVRADFRLARHEALIRRMTLAPAIRQLGDERRD